MICHGACNMHPGAPASCWHQQLFMQSVSSGPHDHCSGLGTTVDTCRPHQGQHSYESLKWMPHVGNFATADQSSGSAVCKQCIPAVFPALNMSDGHRMQPHRTRLMRHCLGAAASPCKTDGRAWKSGNSHAGSQLLMNAARSGRHAWARDTRQCD